MNYLVNVFLTFAPYLISAIVVGAAVPYLVTRLAHYTVKKIVPEGYEQEKPTIDRWCRIVSAMLAVIGVIIFAIGSMTAFSSPSNLPKNETHDREAFARKYQDLPAFQEKRGIITDRTRPADMTPPQRQQMFDDMVDWRDANDRKTDR